ncbi:hypothetical protein [Fodinicola acaciae]|nr:hypothetical protein [Fodinicola acaciae]
MYDARTGDELTRRDGLLAGAGDNWVAIAPAGRTKAMEFVRL